MSLRRTAMIAFLGASLAAIQAAWASETPVREVTLSSGGLAEIVREAAPGGGSSLRIDVPLAQVDDVLKSLVVRGGTVQGMSLAGPEPIDEVFGTMPFTPGELGRLPSLLAALQGVEASVTSGGKTVEGRVLGVETRQGPDGAMEPLLTVMSEEGSVMSLLLGHDAQAVIKDEGMRRKVAEAAAAAGRGTADGARTVEVSLGGEAAGVSLSYVVPAPVWKTAYRAVVGVEGQARLQAWAVLENASGEDWTDVGITLSSGDPVTLRQRLHQRYWREREEVPVDVSARAAPPPDRGAVRSRAMAESAPMSAPMPAMSIDMASEDAASGRDFAMASPRELGQASEGDVQSSYRLPGRYDLANGDTLSVPIADAEVEAEMVSVFRYGQHGQHPVAAVLLSNPTGVGLPGGIVTVYGDGGYVGDARLLGLPAGESRMASFATDQKVSVRVETQPQRHLVSVRAVDGVVRVSVRDRETVAYHLDGAADGDREVIIEHPRRDGWEFSSPAAAEGTVTHHRLRASVPAGETATVTAVHETLREERHSLNDAHASTIAGWAGGADPETRAAMEALAEARREQAEAEAALRDIEARASEAERAQARVRDNLMAVPQGSDQHARYLADLSEREDELRSLERSRNAARDELARLGEIVREAVRAF